MPKSIAQEVKLAALLAGSFIDSDMPGGGRIQSNGSIASLDV